MSRYEPIREKQIDWTLFVASPYAAFLQTVIDPISGTVDQQKLN